MAVFGNHGDSDLIFNTVDQQRLKRASTSEFDGHRHQGAALYHRGDAEHGEVGVAVPCADFCKKHISFMVTNSLFLGS